MAYWRDKWEFVNSNEYEYKFAGKYGARGEKRAEKKKATPEQIKKQNQINKENRMRRLIKANFTKRDYWMCLKYPEGTRKRVEEVKEDLQKFLNSMRKRYKKKDKIFKFVYRMEIGELGGIHIHILFNRIPGEDTDLIAKEIWDKGTVNYQTLYDSGGYKKLANYIVKEPTEEVYEQIEMFEKEDQKHFIRYSTSRNLIRPLPKRKHYGNRTVRKLMDKGPQPTPGYYIDKDSVYKGVNPYTGMSYLKYTEYRIKEIEQEPEAERGKHLRKKSTYTRKRHAKDRGRQKESTRMYSK